MWLETNESLEKRVFSEIGVVSLRKLEGGLVNSVYHVELKNGVSGVLRITDNKTEEWISKKERAVLSHFDGFPFFPKILFHGELNELNLSFNIISFFEGDNMHTIKEIPKSKVFLCLGEILGRIHSYKATEFGFVYDFDNIGADPRVHNSYPGPYKNGFEQHFIPAKGWVEHLVSKRSRFSEQLRKIIVKMEEQEDLFDGGECTYNHGDFQFKNILTYSSRLVGIVDFDSFRYGDPASDMHLFLQNYVDKKISKDLISSFIEGYVNIRPLPHRLFEKSVFYRCYRGIEKVITLPIQLRYNLPEFAKPYKKKIEDFLQSIVDGSDPCMGLSYEKHIRKVDNTE
ncbi:MAG: aminoglycoside phosphotransferase family protein [Nanoarchaeota archaeon]|nr:aminoglycoside phosphotransferase family protein [Nanoarchaeota archaeon]MBU1597569.1 aminoglycoside phosphotransferase family protein [Nanoarchaeota archaeon]